MRFFNLDVVSPGQSIINYFNDAVETNFALMAAIAGGVVIVSAGIAVGVVFSVKAARKRKDAAIDKKLEEARAARDAQNTPDSKE